MKTVKITYEEFLWIKQAKYAGWAIKQMACKYLGIKPEEIDDIDWNYKLTFDVYLKDPEPEYNDDLPF